MSWLPTPQDCINVYIKVSVFSVKHYLLFVVGLFLIIVSMLSFDRKHMIRNT